jgi:hypothetical protein
MLITENRKVFDDKLLGLVEKKKNVVIYSQSSAEAKEYEKKLMEKFPDTKVMVYQGKTDDKVKSEHFSNVNHHWKQYQVVIMTPTVEAGINFDQEHFHQAFGILSLGANSQRGFLQMSCRVRKLENNEFIVFHDRISKNKDSVDY